MIDKYNSTNNEFLWFDHHNIYQVQIHISDMGTTVASIS